MKINGIDIRKYDAKQLTADVQPPSFANSYEWLTGAALPTEFETEVQMGHLKLSIYFKGKDRNNIIRAASEFMSNFTKACKMELDGYKGTIEIEPSQRNDNAILSANEFTELENRVKGHIESIDSTNEAVKKAEQARVTAENARVKAEQARANAENNRQQNENTRIQQEQQRQQDTSQAVKNANDATDESKRATTACKEVTERAEDALQNQEQLEATLNTATQIRQDVSQMQTAVAEAKKQVEQDKKDIDDTIQNSLLASAEKILESVQDYFNRAEALYSSMYLDCDGETPYLRTVTPVFIDGATPQVRNANEGVDFDGGTPTSRQLAV